MSYVVRYDGMVDEKTLQQMPRKGRKGVAVLILVAAMTIGNLYPQAVAELRSWLIPGEDAVTVAAFHSFQDMLEDGAPFGECVTAFCMEVLGEE